MDLIKGFAVLEVKGFGDGKQGYIKGRLSDIQTDRSGDIVVPTGLKFKLPLPLRYQHGENVGTIFAAEVTDKHVDIEGQLADPEEAQSATIRERLLTAWDSVRLGLARGLSIGFRPIKSEPIPGSHYGRKFLEAELIEGSIVEIPDNARATIQVVKSYASRHVAPQFSRLDPEEIRRYTRTDGAVHL